MYEYFEGVLKRTLAENLRLLHGILSHQAASELRLMGSVKSVFSQDAAGLFTDFEDSVARSRLFFEGQKVAIPEKSRTLFRGEKFVGWIQL